MKNYLKFILVLIALIAFTNKVQADEPINDQKGVYSFMLNDIDGKNTNLSQFKGKVLLIVNTASRCGYTRQYASLEGIFEKFKDRGLVVLGFPANNFMGQEPGTNEEIKSFCSLKFNVTFPMFAKISVAGSDMHPLYQFLTSQSGMEGPISWNFNKFLVDQEGHVVMRFDSSTDPLSQEMISAIEKLFPVQ